MTRQPALEKRIAVAWPMPRLAPVRSSVRRGALAELDMVVLQATGVADRASWIKPCLGPGVIRRVAAEFDAIVQAERTVVPEFEPRRDDAPAAPARRPRYFADDVLGGDLGDCLLEGKTAFQRLRLLAGPGADLGLLGPGREICVGFRFRHGRHVAADAHLPAQRFPVKQ